MLTQCLHLKCIKHKDSTRVVKKEFFDPATRCRKLKSACRPITSKVIQFKNTIFKLADILSRFGTLRNLLKTF